MKLREMKNADPLRYQLILLKRAARRVIRNGPCNDPDCCPTAIDNAKATEALKNLLEKLK